MLCNSLGFGYIVYIVSWVQLLLVQFGRVSLCTLTITGMMSVFGNWEGLGVKRIKMARTALFEHTSSCHNDVQCICTFLHTHGCCWELKFSISIERQSLPPNCSLEDVL